MIRIQIHNSRSQVFTESAEQLQALRRIVSYQQEDLPPSDVQSIIKGYFKDRPRHPDLLWLSGAMIDRLAELGWGRDRLTKGQISAVIRNPGVWDGWTSLVNTRGWYGTGLTSFVQRALTLHLGVPQSSIRLEDARMRYGRVSVPWTGPDLFPFQREAVDRFLTHSRGVLDLPPRSGKTHTAIAAIRELGLPALVIVPTVPLVEQTEERFKEFFPHEQVVGISGGKQKPETERLLARAMVWISTPPTAAGSLTKLEREAKVKKKGMPGILTRKVIVFDEVHHLGADGWQTISDAAANAYYRLGLTGTHYRNDRKDLVMHAGVGPAIYKKTVSEMVDIGRLVPADVAVIRVPGVCTTEGGYDLYRDGIVNYEPRNALIAYAAQWLMHAGRRTLILTKEVAHSEELAKRIGPGCAQVDGRTTSELRGLLDQLARKTIQCLVGTSVIGEGVDVPEADALIYAAGARSKVKQVQDYFRVLTASAGKRAGLVIDFADCHAPALLETSARRLLRYRSEHCFRSVVIDAHEFSSWLSSRL